jgi:hypothetical protein
VAGIAEPPQVHIPATTAHEGERRIPREQLRALVRLKIENHRNGGIRTLEDQRSHGPPFVKDKKGSMSLLAMTTDRRAARFPRHNPNAQGA